MKTVAIEQAKLKIKESLAATDTLIDQRELAAMLGIDIEEVDKAYAELVKEGVVHKETYFLWKNPIMRQRLLEAMQSTETIPFEVVRERLGI